MDKSSWPRGPWDNEPDEKQWVDDATGYQCLIVRKDNGALCGYVGVDMTHSLYEVSLDFLLAEMADDFQVHGGLTYAGRIPDRGDVWWLGFDCAHFLAGDFVPGDPWAKLTPHMKYYDFAYVENEVRRLAALMQP